MEEYHDKLLLLNEKIEILNGLFQTISVGIMIVDENRNIKDVNRVIEDMTFEEKSEIIGKKGGRGLRCYSSLYIEECGSGSICVTCPFLNSVEAVLKYGNPILDLEIRPELLINDELKKPFLRVNFLPVMLSGKRHVLLIIEDITKEKANSSPEAVEENESALNERRENDELKNQFITNMSHELRTPLNVILGTLQLFEKTCIEHSVKDDLVTYQKFLNIMKQNSYRLMKLVNNLIEVSNLDSGLLKLNCKRQDIVNIVENITLSAVNYANDREIDLVFDTDIEEKIMACDVEQIERAILNILSNAIKFNRKHGKIEVNIYDKIENIMISVRDTGIGIPQNMLEEIFGRYKQVDAATTRRKEGSGIGLFIAKSIIEGHSGKIEVKSKLGEGSEFIVTLPVGLGGEYNNSRDTADMPKEINVEKAAIEFSDIYVNE
ncbi:MAG: ATP-binding protein [Bacillota bacterium]